LVPEFSASDSATAPEPGAALAVAAGPDLQVRGPDLGVSLNPSFLAAAGFAGDVGQVQAVPGGDRTVFVVGVGTAGCGRDDLRRAGAALGRAAARVESLVTTLHLAGDGREGAAQAVVEGIGLAGYSFRPPPENRAVRLRRVQLVDAPAGEVDRGRVTVAATVRARDWVNRPAGDLTPATFAGEVSDLAAAAGLEVEVWDDERIAGEGLGLLAGVAAGSAEAARLVRVTYDPPGGASGHLALVGKGITFDSGGLAIKPLSSMQRMKSDMGGAAAVLAATLALPDLAPNVRVDGWAALAENMPGGRATKPGDVHTARDGTTVEVVNPDAEGRLVMADTILTARRRDPDAVVDVATLTGGQRVALGRQVAAVLGTDHVVERLEAAGAAAGEPVWRLPLWPGYRSLLDSDVADLRNVAPDGEASTIMASLFLQRFAGDTPWGHLDIAAPSGSDKQEGWLSRGATGWGARTLIELACLWQ
jgi:leucyl aminopeptidase